MNIEKVKLVTFSPTGNSTKVAESIAKGIKASVEHIDLTPPTSRTLKNIEFGDQLIIFSVPVYAGRVPSEAAYRIRKIRPQKKPYGHERAKTPAIIVVTYGNRAYEDALRELGDIVSEVGFKPIGAAAFVGEHSWSVPEKPTAHGRPDSEDLAKSEAFGEKIREKFDETDDVESLSMVEIPGTNPYSLSIRGELTWYDVEELFTPFTDESVCVKCGKCVEVCPTASIIIKNVVSNPSPMIGFNVDLVSTDDDSCIWCCACLKNCPKGARSMRPRMIQSQESLTKHYTDRKEPETYL